MLPAPQWAMLEQELPLSLHPPIFAAWGALEMKKDGNGGEHCPSGAGQVHPRHENGRTDKDKENEDSKRGQVCLKVWQRTDPFIISKSKVKTRSTSWWDPSVVPDSCPQGSFTILKLIHCYLKSLSSGRRGREGSRGLHTSFPNVSILETRTSFPLKGFA